MSSVKTILIVEDEELVRQPLVSSLRMRGFNAERAGTVDEARALIEHLRDKIDVMVLDMRLEDPKHPDMTGAKLGIEMRRAHPQWLPPEFLIFSAYRNVNYYAAALELGAAAYLQKNIPQDELIRHIRSLALCRALSIERKEIKEKIEDVVHISNTPSAAVIDFCRQVLAPEMRACLGAPFIFLLSDMAGGHNCGSDTDLPSGYDPAYARLQALIFGASNSLEPFIFDGEQVEGSLRPETKDIYKRLHGGAFLPLFNSHYLRLSLGILRADESYVGLPEAPDKLARILSSYLRPAIIEHLISVLSQLAAAVERTQRNTLLEHTSRFCLYVGQTQLDVLNEAVDSKEINPDSEYYQKLKKLASDLLATGNEFSQLSDMDTLREIPAGTFKPVSISSVVRQAWQEIREQFPVERLSLQEIGEDFNLEIERNDLLVAVLRVLQWMVQREDKTPADVVAAINVEYAKKPRCGEIIFTDTSRRLGHQLRRKLFEPFTQATPPPLLSAEDDDERAERPGLYLPLYLAKTLVEVKNDGVLEDRSDSVDGRLGHRFVMKFPMVKDQSFSTKAITRD